MHLFLIFDSGVGSLDPAACARETLAGIEQWLSNRSASQNSASAPSTLKELHLVSREDSHFKALVNECMSHLNWTGGGAKAKLLRSDRSASFWRNPDVRGGTPLPPTTSAGAKTIVAPNSATTAAVAVAVASSGQQKSSTPFNAGSGAQSNQKDSQKTAALLGPASKPAAPASSAASTTASTSTSSTVPQNSAALSTSTANSSALISKAGTPAISAAVASTSTSDAKSSVATTTKQNAFSTPKTTSTTSSSSTQVGTVPNRVTDASHEKDHLLKVILDSAPRAMDSDALARYLQDALAISSHEAEAAVRKFRGNDAQAASVVIADTNTRAVNKDQQSTRGQTQTPARTQTYFESGPEKESPSENLHSYKHIPEPVLLRKKDSSGSSEAESPRAARGHSLHRSRDTSRENENGASSVRPRYVPNPFEIGSSSGAEESLSGSDSKTNAKATIPVSRVDQLLNLADSSHSVDTWTSACHQSPLCPTVGTHNQLITNAVLIESSMCTVQTSINTRQLT